MADKLDWMNKHLVVIRYVTLKDVVEKEGYKIPPDIEELFAGVSGAEDMIFKLAGSEKYKEACQLMVYIAHKRAAVWWGYRCVLSLMEELQINPAKEAGLDSIDETVKMMDINALKAKMKEIHPEWPQPPPIPKASGEDIAAINENLAKMDADYQKAKAGVNPKMLKLVQDEMEKSFQQYKAVHGIHPLDKLKELGEALKKDPYAIDYNAPIFQQEALVKAKLQAEAANIKDTLQTVLPPRVPAHRKKVKGNALSAVYAWVAAPNAENSQKCLDIGNECSDTAEGLLSLSAFWSFGDLLPLKEDQTVPTPPGLAPNGINGAFLMCALHQGGTRKPKERFEEYFRLGVEVLTGADNWEASVGTGKAPHEEEGYQADGSPRQQDNTAGENVYKRWKPGEPRG